MNDSFNDKYGPWALVAGASMGLGLTFSKALVRRGLNVVMVAEERTTLERAKSEAQLEGPGTCRTFVQDLSQPDAVDAIDHFTRELEVGLLVCNATHRDLGPFLSRSLEDHLAVVAVNCRAPVALAHRFGVRMAARNRGGMIFMASLTAFQGTPCIATYGASKAFNLVFGEALRTELMHKGIDVLVSSPGAVATPNYLTSIPEGVADPSPVMQPQQVVQETLDALGRRALHIPGWKNRLIQFALTRLMSRELATTTMGRFTQKLYGSK